MYVRAGLREAWLIDVDSRVLHSFTAPDPSAGYREQSTASIGQKISAAALPDVTLELAELFRGS